MITIEQVHDFELHDLFRHIRKSLKEGIAQRDYDISTKLSPLVVELGESLYNKNEKIREILYTEGELRNQIGGLRTLVKQFPLSLFYHDMSEIFNLGPLFKDVVTWGTHLSFLLRTLNCVDREYRIYSKNVVSAANLMNEYYPVSDTSVFIEDPRVRTYATYKTWNQDSRYDAYTNNMATLFDVGFEVFVEGPLTLYVKLTKDDIVCLIRLVSTSLNPRYEHGESEKLFPLLLHDIISSEAREGGTIDSILTLLKNALHSAVQDKIIEENIRRSFIQEWSERKEYILKFESGKFFKQKEK